MHHRYNDIIRRIAEPPQWWDEHGVPRWGPWSPDECANIYADEAALVLIACQGCGTQFYVAFTQSYMDHIWEHHHLTATEIHALSPTSLGDWIQSGDLHYGDPPNTGCCLAGATMNCEDLNVMEYWHRRTPSRQWIRDPSLELLLPGHPHYVHA